MTTKVILKVQGLADSISARRVEAILMEQPGIVSAHANSTVGRVLIEYEQRLASLTILQNLLLTILEDPLPS